MVFHAAFDLWYRFKVLTLVGTCSFVKSYINWFYRILLSNKRFQTYNIDNILSKMYGTRHTRPLVLLQIGGAVAKAPVMTMRIICHELVPWLSLYVAPVNWSDHWQILSRDFCFHPRCKFYTVCVHVHACKVPSALFRNAYLLLS